VAKKPRSRAHPSQKKASARSPKANPRRPRSRAAKPVSLARRVLNARPDGLDFRDHMYSPTLVEVPRRRELAEYQRVRVPIRDQGEEGACTGFGLATVAEYLLRTWDSAGR